MLEGKIAIVTGGATGIGAATSRLLAANGAHVVIASEQPIEAIEAFAGGIVASGGSASAIRCDVTDEDSISALVAEVDARHGRLDILVNCAGLCVLAPLEEMNVAQIRALLAVNTIGPILLTKAALPVMRRGGGGGAVVNISSGSAVIGVEGLAVYSASKAALAHFTRTLAPELRRSGIRVNAIAPGSVRTPMLGFIDDDLSEAQQASIAKREAGTASPYGNAMMEPDDIAQVVLFLASDAARGLQGSLVVADQGFSGAMPRPG
jgi:NAD(P)-dependent dehydrogenase (short-subunit alcohol dehydrogenase family)